MADEDVHITCPKCYADVIVKGLEAMPPGSDPVVKCDSCGRELNVNERLRAKQRAWDQARRWEEREAAQREREAAWDRCQAKFREARRRVKEAAAHTAREVGADAERRRQRRAEEAAERAREDPDDVEGFFAEPIRSLTVFAFFLPVVAPVVAVILISGTRLPRHAARHAALSVRAGAWSLIIGAVLLVLTLGR